MPMPVQNVCHIHRATHASRQTRSQCSGCAQVVHAFQCRCHARTRACADANAMCRAMRVCAHAHADSACTWPRAYVAETGPGTCPYTCLPKVFSRRHNYYRHLGIADGMSVARVWACRYSERPPRQGGQFEYQHAHTRAIDMPSAMAIYL